MPSILLPGALLPELILEAESSSSYPRVLPKQDGMRSKGSRADSALPSYLAGTLLVRGRTRLIWTGVIICVFLFGSLPIEQALGETSGAAVALLAFPIAWMWGRSVGAAAAGLASLVNFYFGSTTGLESSAATATVFDTIAIVLMAFFIGHVSETLERALGARYRADQAYSELEQTARERMLTITDQVPVGLYRTTPEGRIVGGNEALLRILGFPDQAALIQANVWELYVRSEDRQAQIAAAGSSDSEWREFELRRADGEVIWVRDWSVGVENGAGRTEHFDGVLEDITEQRLADARFRAAFEDSPIGMAIAGFDGRIVRANAAVADLLGLPIDEIQGIHFSDYSFDEDLEVTRSALENLSEGRVVRYEKRMRRKDGSVLWALINLAPIYEGTDRPTHFISHVVDVSERRNAQEQLEQLVRSKDELIASVSHELRTPLTVVHGLAQELDTGWLGFSIPEQKEFIGMIAQQSAEVAYIVEDLLVAARADIGKLPMHPSRVNLVAQLESAVAGIGDGGISVDRVGSKAPVAFADDTRVRQIVRNLLSNAERYGGTEIFTRCGASGNTAWLEVADNGEGIPEADVRAVFEPYVRSHNAEGQPLSVGLGLTVSLKLSELMGGTLAYRREDGWAVFRLELPAAGSVHAMSGVADAGTSGA